MLQYRLEDETFPTPAEVLTCDLSEPDGQPLGRGVCRVHAAPDGSCTVAAVLDQSNRIVTRCLLGPVEAVEVQLPGAVTLHTKIERIFFDPRHGRTCLLRVVDGM